MADSDSEKNTEKKLSSDKKVKVSVSGAKIWLLLWKSGRSVEKRALACIAKLGMSLTDFAVLEVLLHKGPLPVNTIGKKVLLTSGSITTAVDRLEEKGLVERLDAPTDRRVRLVSLTKEGTKRIEIAFAEHQKHLEVAVSPLTKDEQRQLVELLTKLGQGADLQGSTPCVDRSEQSYGRLYARPAKATSLPSGFTSFL